jgi:hypothetical protein
MSRLNFKLFSPTNHSQDNFPPSDTNPHATNFNPFTKNQPLASAEDNAFAKDADSFAEKCRSPGGDFHSFAGDKALFARESFSFAAVGRSMAAERHSFA